jgi:cation diffusion facilitator family transporter
VRRALLVAAILRGVSPQRRTALVSIVAACVLIAVKLVAGIATDSLGLLSEAAHSGTDLIAAILTFVALGVAGRPADPGHAYGHGKAEHLAALAEAAILVGASLLIAWRALARLTGMTEGRVDPRWYAVVVIAVVIVIDAARATVSYRAGRRYRSAALQANALHFASDLAGSAAVLVGLLAARAGYHWADSAAALFVAVLVLVAATRLMRVNVDVLMDRVPPEAQEAALAAISGLGPAVELRRLRMRQAAGRQFADVVIGVPPGAAVGQGHAAADAVEAAVHRALPDSDVVVHVEPRQDEAALRERALAAAQRVPRVREIHNLTVLRVNGSTEVSLHLKLPGDLPLEEAHEVANEVERAIRESVPEVDAVQTHLEPLAEAGEGRSVDDAAAGRELVERIVREETGEPPRELRFLHTDDGLLAYLTLCLDPSTSLAAAHARASEIEERIRRERPEISDVIVHTEP